LTISEERAWQDDTHARVFDEVSLYPDFLMRKRFESFNEVRLLREAAATRTGCRTLYEIGCATGEFGRYVERYLPQLAYRGFDISRPAIERALAKYGSGKFTLYEGHIRTFAQQFGGADIVFCRDVVLHQLDPYAFLSELLNIARGALILRLRTRDVGATVLDAEQSCQYHYDRHWVPYIVLNTDELIARLSGNKHVHHITISRRYEPLGGHNFRYLPKELFYSETRTAETAVLALKESGPRAGAATVAFDDRPDGPRYSILDRVVLKLARTYRRGAAK